MRTNIGPFAGGERADETLRRAGERRRDGALDDALGLYWQAAELAPERPEAHTGLSEVLRALGRPEEALHCQRRAVRLMPEDGAAQAALAERLCQLGRYKEAFGWLRRAAERRQDDAASGFALAECLLGLGRFSEALAENERVLALAPDHPGLYAQCVAAMRGLGRLADSRSSFAGALRAVALAAQERRDWAMAIRACSVWVSLAPGSIGPLEQLAKAYRMAGRYDDADALLEPALAAHPDRLSLAFEHAWGATFRKDWDEAKRRWDAIIDRHPDLAQALAARADTLGAAGRHDEAEHACLDALARFPAEVALLTVHARLAQWRRDWQTAVARWQALKERYPDREDIDALIASARQKAGL